MFKRRGVKEPARVPPGQDRIATPIPAPGGLEVVQAILNTLDVKAETDELRTPAALAALLSRHGLLASGVELGRKDLERALQVRRGLRSLLLAHSGGEADEEAVASLDRAALGARAQVRFDRDGNSRLEPAGGDFDEALGTLLGFVHEARCTGKWPSFKLCANGECRRSFFDFTKSRTGKWCTRRCGERVRARAFRRSGKYRRGYRY